MALRVHIREGSDRAIALVSSSHVLTFRLAPGGRPPPGGAPKPSPCMLDFKPAADADLRGFVPMRAPPVHGTLGLFAVQADVFVCVITGATPAAVVRPDENVQRIMAVDFLCLSRGDFDHLVGSSISAGLDDPYEDRIALGYAEDAVVHPCQALQHVLGGGTFYYSVDFDLTTRLQARIHERSAFDPDALDRGFLWNAYLLEPLLQFRSHLPNPERKALDEAHLLTLAIRGYVGAVTIPSSICPLRADPHQPSMLTLISRLSCRRAGTRFNARGIDDEGNVANFVETETIYYAPDGRGYSFTQVRGSVPVFWEQTGGLLPQQQKIQLTRSREATQPAFDRHFEDLELKYGSVQILNLLGQSKSGEVELTNRYNQHVRACSINARAAFGKESADSEHAMLQAIHFDYNAESRSGQAHEVDRMLRQLVREPMDGFAFFMAVGLDPSHTAVLLQQEGVFRVNCLDCLDRTNLAQTLLSRVALESYFSQQQYQHEHFTSQKHQSLPQYVPPPASAVGAVSAGFWPRHSTLWADNGDALSRIYAGTGALKSSVTRHGKVSLAGALADARKTATRMYMNAFVDTSRQAVIDALLGRASLNASGEAIAMDDKPGSVQLYDPLHAAVNAALAAKKDIYTTFDNIIVWSGSFNLNGRRTGLKAELDAWLWPRIKMASGKISGGTKSGEMAQSWTDEAWADEDIKPDIVAVGFQEIVELNANNIMQTEPTRRQEWEDAVARTLNKGEKKGDYVLLRSGQLVGAALLVFVKSVALPMVRNAEGAIKKTGMSGMAGNKGAVAIRLDYAQTRLCFVTAHLAAGFANYDERNRDYGTIAHGLRFPRGRGLADHDAVIWLGDFNYRIGLTNEKVRPAAFDSTQWPSLFRHDQLNLQMVAGNAFPYFHEAPIRFAPTYRYDVGTDTYDSSEKQRIPAWTDRVLWRGEIVKALAYGAAPVRCSDHKPVFGLFRVRVSVEDERKKTALRKQIDKEMVEKGVGSTEQPKSDDDVDLLGEESREVEGGRWWLSNGLPVRSTVADDHPNSVPNPRRPANPFTPSTEPDWVMVPRPESSRSSTGKALPSATSKPSEAKSRAPPEVPPPRRSKAAATPSTSSTPSSSPAPPRPSSAAATTHRVEPSNLDGAPAASQPETVSRIAKTASTFGRVTSTSSPGAPIALHPRAASSASTNSNANAPPIPRKPISLSTSATGGSGSTTSSTSGAAPYGKREPEKKSQQQSPSPTPSPRATTRPPFAPRPSAASTSPPAITAASVGTAPRGTASSSLQQSRPVNVVNTGFPPPPRRMTGPNTPSSAVGGVAASSLRGSGAMQGEDRAAEAKAPPLPQRRPTGEMGDSVGMRGSTNAAKRETKAVPNVMDGEQEGGLEGFAALKPDQR